MFRPMRRYKQQLSEKETTKILEQGKTGVLGVTGDEGYPYTVPVNYVYYDGKIYLHCAKMGHKLDAIRQCSKVSFCVVEKDDVVADELTAYFRSAVIFGRARILEAEDEIVHAAMALGLKYYDNPEAVNKEVQQSLDRLCCIEIRIEHITGKEAIELVRKGK